MVVAALVIFSSSVSYARTSWKREHKHGDIVTFLVLCSPFLGTPSLGDRKLHSLVPCPSGPRKVSGSCHRQSRVLHGSCPSLSYYVQPFPECPALGSYSKCFSSHILHPRVQGAKVFWAPHAGGLRVKNLWPWKLVSFDHPLFDCSGNMLNYKRWSQEWCNHRGAINQYSHCAFPGGK